MSAVSSATDSDHGPRDRSIPVHKADLLDALIEHGALGSDAKPRFRRFARMLALIYHYEFFDCLERLHQNYYYLDPELDPHTHFDQAAYEKAYADLRDTLLSVLREANFVEVPHAEIERAHRERAVLQVEVKAPLDDFREIRFFRRGRHRESFTVTDWFGLHTRMVEAEVYDEVVMFAAVKPPAAFATEHDRKRLHKRGTRPGAVLIKSFHDIASADINALFPNIRVVMSTLDQLVLSVPALIGGVPIVLNLASTITVLFVVIGFYLGLSGAVEDNALKKAFAAMSGLVALGGFVMRQWLRYQRQALKYHKELTDNIYFRNIDNNAGLFDSLVGEAEDQDVKEAFLACCFLATSAEPSTKETLDERIERWLVERFGIEIDFDIGDALAKLERLGLLRREDDKLSILPIGEILARLERAWGQIISAEATP